MLSYRRAAILKLAANAIEIDLPVMQGRIQRTADGWRIGHHDLLAWLAAHEGEEIVTVLGSLEDDRPIDPQTCRKCGRDYVDTECPHCRRNREHFRGRGF